VVKPVLEGLGQGTTSPFWGPCVKPCLFYLCFADGAAIRRRVRCLCGQRFGWCLWIALPHVVKPVLEGLGQGTTSPFWGPCVKPCLFCLCFADGAAIRRRVRCLCGQRFSWCLWIALPHVVKPVLEGLGQGTTSPFWGPCVKPCLFCLCFADGAAIRRRVRCMWQFSVMGCRGGLVWRLWLKGAGLGDWVQGCKAVAGVALRCRAWGLQGCGGCGSGVRRAWGLRAGPVPVEVWAAFSWSVPLRARGQCQ
jgi:hypothetical protein